MAKRAKAKTKSDRAYELLRESLAAGTFSPGERLTEAKVARALGLGRVPVRESLLRLEAEGVLKSPGPYGGMYVEYFEDQRPENLLHRYELREAIESAAARLAARNMRGWEIEELRTLAAAMAAARGTPDRETRRRASQAFHHYLLANCGNPLLAVVWEAYHLQPVTPRSPELEARILGNIPDEPRHNECLQRTVEAIAAHDPDQAERWMRDYVHGITEAIRRVIVEEEHKGTAHSRVVSEASEIGDQE